MTSALPIEAGMPLYGIIGYPLTHSFSPAYFRRKFAEQHIEAAFEAFEVIAADELLNLVKTYPQLRGLSVTIPHKEAVIPLLDEVDGTAWEIGAVNCIAIKEGIAKGYNTDVIGFEQSLAPLLEPGHTHALILGTGGASKAVAYVLKQLGISYEFVSRGSHKGVHAYGSLTADAIASHKLIVNTTPLGMYPNMDDMPPIPYEGVGSGHLLYDLIYNPEQTKFLAMGRQHGAAVKNGFGMLELQAEASWRIWTGGGLIAALSKREGDN